MTAELTVDLDDLEVEVLEVCFNTIACVYVVEVQQQQKKSAAANVGAKAGAKAGAKVPYLKLVEVDLHVLCRNCSRCSLFRISNQINAAGDAVSNQHGINVL